MLSEYRGKCPKCGELRASYSRELGSRQVHVNCSVCGLKLSRTLPPVDEQAQKTVYFAASKALDSASQKIVQAAKSRPGTAGCEICRTFLPLIHTQLAYLLRLLQFPAMMDGKLEAIMSNDIDRDDITHDAWMAENTLTEDAILRLDNQYFGFQMWMNAGLRALGLNDEEIAKYRDEWWETMEEREARHLARGGLPFQAVRVAEERIASARARVEMFEREKAHLCLRLGCRKPVLGPAFVHCEAHLDDDERALHYGREYSDFDDPAYLIPLPTDQQTTGRGANKEQITASVKRKNDALAHARSVLDSERNK